MTPNDAQIDLLLRRHAGQAQQGKGNSATEHLDADELNAFAEGSLPPAARSRYMSHLADCNDCRKVASQLAISGGAVVGAEVGREPQGYAWWKRLSGIFSPLTLRYAAFAVVLVAVVGVVFLVMRGPREPALIAQRESANQPQVSAVKPAESALPEGANHQEEKAKAYQSSTTTQPEASPIVSKPESKAGENPQPASKPEPETSVATSPMLAAKKAPEPVTAESSPSYAYALPPPGEVGRAGTLSRERQDLARDVASGPRKSETPSDKSKMMDQSRAGEMSKDVRGQDDSNRAAVNQPQSNIQRQADEKAAPGREADTLSSRDRNAKESRAQAPAPQSAGAGSRAASEEAPQTRSAGGRKFRRQGNAWVDSKYKSSMTVKSIARGSSEFDALDSGLRSIAQQLGGEVIVVWKSKAYLIR